MSKRHEKTKEATMKRTLILSLLAALLGGCAIVPYGYRYHSYYRNSYPGYGYYNYGYPRSYGYYGYRYQDHGG